MEQSNLAGNAITFLHDEDYLKNYQEPKLTVSQYCTTSGRQPIDLSGTWYFTLDRFDTGLRQRWFELKPTDQPRHQPIDYDPYQGNTIEVPSSWNLINPEWYLYEGGAWYSRTIEDPRQQSDQRVVLRIGAANYGTRIFLNGHFLGCHLGGSTPFFVDLSEHMTPAAHLMIHVENTRQSSRLPSCHTDWFNYGGIHRSVNLFVLPKAHIRDAHIYWNNKKGIVCGVHTSSEGPAVILEIPELSFSEKIEGVNQQYSASFNIPLQLWSPDHPHLYDVIIRWQDDIIYERIGFRSIEIQSKTLLLNGKPLFVRGVCVHEDDQALGRVTTIEDIQRRLDHAKELNCNFLRLSHYPHHEQVTQMADEQGFLLWEELPAYWAVDFDSPETLADAKNQLTELIVRDRNRASVLCWSLANETPDTDKRLQFFQQLANHARSLDPNRPLTAACLFNQASLKIEDRLADLVDIVGINEYFGWYDPDFSDLDQLLAQYDLNKPLVISETGVSVKAGYHGKEETLFTEEFGDRFYREQLSRLGSSDKVQGLCAWVLYDFRSERRQNIYQNGWNRKGLIAEDKTTKKQIFHRLAAFYKAKATYP